MILVLYFALGVCLLQLLPELSGAVPVLVTTAALLLAAWRLLRLRPPAALALGFAWAWVHAAWQLQHALPADLEGRDLEVSGVVAGLPEPRGEAVRFPFHIDGLEGSPGVATFTGLVRLTWYRDPPPLVAGDRWHLWIRLKAPHGYANPGGFDYEGWLFRHGIKATGYVRGGEENRRLAGQDLAYGVDRLRQGLRERILQALDGVGSTGLVLALTLGDRSAIGSGQWDTLTRTGTNHLIAISGLHVGIVAGLAYFLALTLWRRSRRLSLAWAAQRAAAVAALLVATGYAALAGFAVSTQRALIMLAVVLGALVLRRTTPPVAGLLAALGLVLLLDPMAVLGLGFWLSFAAVAVLLYGMNRRVGRGGSLWRLLRAQWLVALGLLPLLLLLFGRASLVAPLVNLVAVPLFSLLLLPAVLLATLSALGGIHWPLVAVAGLLDWLYAGLAGIAARPWAVWILPDQPPWVWALAFSGAALLLSPRGLPGRWLGLLLLAPLLWLKPSPPVSGAFRFTLLDVGQGLAAAVQTHDHFLLYDTGPAYPRGFNTGDAVVVPFLRALGIERIDRLIVSHADRDHAGGLAGLVGGIAVDEVLSGEPERLPVDGVRPCRDGMEWRWDGVRFRILHPGRGDPGSSNDRSCVLQVSNAAGALLLSGDVGLGVERALAQRVGDGLRSQLLVAGHHGSTTSSSQPFLEAVAPRQVLFSAGYRNRYGFPRPEVVKRVRALGAVTWGTTESGALSYEYAASGTLTGPRRWREERRRWWTHRP